MATPFNMFNFQSPSQSFGQSLQAGTFTTNEQELIAPKTFGYKAPEMPVDSVKNTTGRYTVDEFSQSIKAKYPSYSSMNNKELARSIIEKYPEYKDSVIMEEEQNFFEGAGSKIADTFKGGFSRIGDAGQKLASGEYNIEQAASRGGAGALQSFFAPITGVAGQVIQEGIEMIPQETKQSIATSAEPAMESIKSWYESQPDDQKQRLRDLGIGAEVLANFIGAKGATTAANAALPSIEQGAKAVATGAKTVAESLKPVIKAPVDIGKSVVNTVKKYVGKPEEVSGIQAAIRPKQRMKNNVLTRTQDQINDEIKLTNGLIRESGVKPVDLETYKNATKSEMEKIGKEIKRLTGQDLNIDMTPTSKKIRDIAMSKEVKLLDPAEGKRLTILADDIAKNGNLTVSEGEAMNQFINDTLRSTTSTSSEAYKRGLQILVGDLRNNLDGAISNIPGEFKQIKKAYGSLRNVYGDTIAREIVYNRQNGIGLVESIGAIEGMGNIVSGGLKMITGNAKSGAADVAKGLTANAVGKFIKAKNDPNNIIKSIFENFGSKTTLPNIKTKVPKTQ